MKGIIILIYNKNGLKDNKFGYLSMTKMVSKITNLVSSITKTVLKITNLVHDIHFYKFKKIKFHYLSTLHNIIMLCRVLRHLTVGNRL
ncbi:hypothetical protein ACS52_13905 [Bacillus cereus]|nr:hypothetical protein ACS52_13905 [Bacillus cereus]